jgi:F-type H+-transporting ATPase subunit b
LLSRFSARLLQSALLAMLALGVAAVPAHVAAQAAPSTPAQSSSATGTQNPGSDMNGLPAQPGQEKKEVKEDDNVYRHTKLVGTLARMFHMDVETTARLFEFINFAIIVLAILIPLAKLLPSHLRKRRETLSQNLESARKTSQDASTRLSAVEAQLAHLDEEIAKFRTQVEEEAKSDEARIKATIAEESARIVAAAEQEITMAAAQAKRGLRHFAADLAIDQAVKQLQLSPETDRALIAEFVSDVSNGAEMTGSKAGKN